MKYRKAGKEIFKCEPFVTQLDQEFRERLCDFCFSPYSPEERKSIGHKDLRPMMEEFQCEYVQRCSACKFVCYCSASCQKQAWKQYHKQECKLLRSEENQKFLGWAKLKGKCGRLKDFFHLIFYILQTSWIPAHFSNAHQAIQRREWRVCWASRWIQTLLQRSQRWHQDSRSRKWI